MGPVSGTWQGTSTSYDNEVRRITLQITETTSGISGNYGCLPQNTACRNLDNSGTLSGKLTRNHFAVMIVMSPDNSLCYFIGTLAESLILGDYECLEGQAWSKLVRGGSGARVDRSMLLNNEFRSARAGDRQATNREGSCPLNAGTTAVVPTFQRRGFRRVRLAMLINGSSD